MTNQQANRIRITLVLSEEAHSRLKELAIAKGTSMAEVLREALRREVWLEGVFNGKAVDLLLRDKNRPDELQRIIRI